MIASFSAGDPRGIHKPYYHGTGALVALEARLWTSSSVPPWVPYAGTWGVCLVTTARFVGDFRYIGVTKRVRGTRFADLDSKLYAPLCLALAAGSAWVAVEGAH